MTHRKWKRWTQSEIDEIRKDYEAGKPVQEIAKRFGVSKRALKQILERHNIKRIPIEKKCLYCGKTFITKQVLHQKFCSKRCCDLYYKYYKPEYRERTLEHQRAYKAKFRKLWGGTGWKGDYHPLVVKSEKFVAEQLANMGFVDVVLTRDHNQRFFPFDILAKKNGEIYVFDVTTSYHKTIKKGARFLLEYLGIKHYYICHVKPDLSWWCMHKIDNKRSSTCMKEFMDYMRAGE